MIRLRFVTEDDHLSELIRLQAGTCMPFTPSHVEALSQDGKFYIGQHFDGGMQARPVGYNDANLLTLPKATSSALMTLPDGTKKSSLIVSLPCTPAQEDAFYAYVHDKIGMPYDWVSILGFVATELHLHNVGSLVCSAIMSAGLRTKFCEYFLMPLATPFHKITPRDLLLILSSHVQIDH